jgi:hypothetical protein
LEGSGCSFLSSFAGWTSLGLVAGGCGLDLVILGWDAGSRSVDGRMASSALGRHSPPEIPGKPVFLDCRRPLVELARSPSKLPARERATTVLLRIGTGAWIDPEFWTDKKSGFGAGEIASLLEVLLPVIALLMGETDREGTAWGVRADDLKAASCAACI